MAPLSADSVLFTHSASWVEGVESKTLLVKISKSLAAWRRVPCESPFWYSCKLLLLILSPSREHEWNSAEYRLGATNLLPNSCKGRLMIDVRIIQLAVLQFTRHGRYNICHLLIHELSLYENVSTNDRMALYSMFFK